MANKKLLWFINLQMCVLIILAVYGITKDAAGGSAVTATGGSVDSVISVAGNDTSPLETATRRGYFTASEYAKYRGISLETVYRQISSGNITNAEKIDGRWHVALP